MAKLVLKDAQIVYGGRDASGNSNSVSLEYSADTPESTAMGDGSRRRLPGLLDVGATINGWWESVSAADSLDADFFARLGAASEVLSITDSGGDVGDVGYSFRSQAASYAPGASIGEVFAFALTITGDDVLIRGEVLQNAAVSSTSNGTARQLGAAASTDTIYSALHVTAVSGTNPTLDVIVQSDDVENFGGTPETQLTHPQMTAVGANWQSAAGAITDTWYRLGFTIGGTDTPTFTVFGIVAIQQTDLP